MVLHICCLFALPPWQQWQGESKVQLFNLDSVGLIPAIAPTKITCFDDHIKKLEQ
jgi:hypothetical protein